MILKIIRRLKANEFITRNINPRIFVFSYKYGKGFYLDLVDTNTTLRSDSEVYKLVFKPVKGNSILSMRSVSEDAVNLLYLKLIDAISNGSKIFDIDAEIEKVYSLLNREGVEL